MPQAHEVHSRTPNGNVRQAVIQRQEKRGADEESNIENSGGKHEASQPGLIIHNMAPASARLSALALAQGAVLLP